jgi:hypothetical protein
MESLKNFVRYSWNSSPKVRTTVINDLIESIKTPQTEGKLKELEKTFVSIHFLKDLPDPALKVLAHTIGQLIPLYITTKSRILLSQLLKEVIQKYKEKILKLIINAFDVQSRNICKVYSQYVIFERFFF